MATMLKTTPSLAGIGLVPSMQHSMTKIQLLTIIWSYNFSGQFQRWRSPRTRSPTFRERLACPSWAATRARTRRLSVDGSHPGKINYNRIYLMWFTFSPKTSMDFKQNFSINKGLFFEALLLFPWGRGNYNVFIYYLIKYK